MAPDLDAIRDIADRVVLSEGLYLVDVELKGGRRSPLLRITIDKPGGISHGDCRLISEQVSALLDVEDPFPGSYTLEVSSPGLDRQIGRPSDFEHFSGRLARLVARGPAGETKVLEGRLAGLTGTRVRIETGAGGFEEVDLTDISKARLIAELPLKARPRRR